MSIEPSKINYIQIFPPIGVARLGDSGFNLDTGKPDGNIDFFLPPEVPGNNNIPDALQGNFRDKKSRIKRMVCGPKTVRVSDLSVCVTPRLLVSAHTPTMETETI